MSPKTHCNVSAKRFWDVLFAPKTSCFGLKLPNGMLKVAIAHEVGSSLSCKYPCCISSFVQMVLPWNL